MATCVCYANQGNGFWNGSLCDSCLSGFSGPNCTWQIPPTILQNTITASLAATASSAAANLVSCLRLPLILTASISTGGGEIFIPAEAATRPVPGAGLTDWTPTAKRASSLIQRPER